MYEVAIQTFWLHQSFLCQSEENTKGEDEPKLTPVVNCKLHLQQHNWWNKRTIKVTQLSTLISWSRFNDHYHAILFRTAWRLLICLILSSIFCCSVEVVDVCLAMPELCPGQFEVCETGSLNTHSCNCIQGYWRLTAGAECTGITIKIHSFFDVPFR